MSLRPHWTRHLEKICSCLVQAPSVLIASDFDGTLAQIMDCPSRAVLSSEAQMVIKSLATLHPRVRLAFLSGRSLADLASRLPIAQENIVLAGNHGLEMSGAGLDWMHPSSAQNRPQIEALVTQLQSLAGGIEGAMIEDKGLGLTLHYRGVASADLPRLHAAVLQMVLPAGIRRADGKKVVEFRPQVDWHKGHALRRIQQHFDIASESTVFLGDDVTDEDAFRELNSRGITLHVGLESAASFAGLHARHPEDAVQFLRAVSLMLGAS
ncbi:MAG: trehalose-phosphatase [Prosthecobacter sp.]|uniref:trehalose-phosphatase n=1 Tax=Prosthecobacter sp. TaxID=1965333 RepID=UPI003BB18E29